MSPLEIAIDQDDVFESVTSMAKFDQSSYCLSDRDGNPSFDTGSDSSISMTSFLSDKISPAMPSKMTITRKDFKETYQRPLHLNLPRGTSTPDGSNTESLSTSREDTESSGADDVLVSAAFKQEKLTILNQSSMEEMPENPFEYGKVVDTNNSNERTSFLNEYSSSTKMVDQQNTSNTNLESNSRYSRPFI